MRKYEIAIGFDNIAGLTAVSPRPASPGLLRSEGRRYSGNGRSSMPGFKWTEWRHSILLPADYVIILTQAGLATADSSEVTVRSIEDDRQIFSLFNAVIDLPEQGRDIKWGMAFYRDVVWVLRHMRKIG